MEMELLYGDIVLFKVEGDDDWLGKCIATLTKSDVSHAAMVYRNQAILEMIASGIAATPFRQADTGDKVYLVRQNVPKDGEPLLRAGDAYLEQGIRYDYPSLVFLAGLLIFKEINFTKPLCTPMLRILECACYALDRFIQQITGRKTMMCSQLVYQIYHDCGPDYAIVIRNGLLQSPQPGAIRLYDHIGQLPPLDNGDRVQRAPGMQSADEAVLARELYEALLPPQQTGPDGLILDYSGIPHDVVRLAREFLELLEKLVQETGLNLPLPSLFVTPADLLNHAENLTKLGELTIKLDG